MVAARDGPSTKGSLEFDPDHYFERWATSTKVENDDLERLINTTFGLKDNDGYVYHAIASVTLAQVQHAIGRGGANNLHAWYVDSNGNQIPPPPQADILAYTTIFSSSTVTSKALAALSSNAKKESLRAGIAKNLTSNRHVPQTLAVPRSKSHVNPYLDLWIWSCQNLEWAGPDESTAIVKQSHHILPIFYHHFGCVCPTYEALEIIKQLAKSRPIFDIGSGNGYWTFMLRRMRLDVTAIDTGDSLWRTMWIGDTLKIDGAKFLANRNGGIDGVLLLVYPQVSGNFTKSVLDRYQGDTICVAGTQNNNGYTAFGDVTIDRYVESEMKGWTKVVQTPLPSFAGKDEALFVFQRDTT